MNHYENKKNYEKDFALYEFVVNNSPEFITLINDEYVYELVSDSFCMGRNKKRGDIVGKTVSEIWGKDIFDRHIRNYYQKGLAGERVNYQEWFDFGTGTERKYYDVAIIPYVNFNKKVTHIMVTTRDITEFMKNLEKVSMMSGRWQSTFDAMNEAICIIDSDNKIVEYNRALPAFYGIDYVIGKHCWEVVHKTAGPCEKCPMLLAKKTGKQEVLELVEGDRALEISAYPLYDKDGKFTGAVHLARDITLKKNMEKEIAKMQKLDALGVLAGGIAHDFNNYLTGIIGNLSVLKEKDSLSAENREIIEESEKVSIMAKNLALELLNFSQVSVPMKKIFDMCEFAKAAAHFILRGTGVQCRIQSEVNVLPVEADKAQIEQVLQNVIINAKQAMPEGGNIDIMLQNCIIANDNQGVLVPGKYVKISVTDYGKGIPDDVLPKIFDPFFTTKQEGNGLGLATAFSIVRKHNGNITAESVPGKGTTFSIFIPATDKTVRKIEKAGEILTGKGRILVMDDEEYILNVIAKMLCRLGYTAELSRNGEEALEKYKSAIAAGNPFDAVILDLTVAGGMGGETAIARLKEIDPDVKAVVSSGYSNDIAISEYEKYGFKAAAVKPYDMATLSHILHRLLDHD